MSLGPSGLLGAPHPTLLPQWVCPGAFPKDPGVCGGRQRGHFSAPGGSRNNYPVLKGKKELGSFPCSFGRALQVLTLHGSRTLGERQRGRCGKRSTRLKENSVLRNIKTPFSLYLCGNHPMNSTKELTALTAHQVNFLKAFSQTWRTESTLLKKSISPP